ncbi:lysylphosphatidylglycerol synthase transmembrane domain-containing protein [Stenotrophomonas sp. SORGH_AS_0321]|uniref:lysylphosphatidylglycerol synthase transmembrane domain-containing protein n=1 Tax=Stenotrophomonas sp. SORGH_AS_0321 TaxID=3041787 RepID=UPI00286529FF|nr:lysylphosphatidylglycerol synthase transmembrane domain-containing protein [Stenotrophomonas sp. SORGH_AS_0321]MDR6095853.1 uncharacterized protein (TIRG00374 family) [Stenotrophomonas sp. SORGH_AS_0321]
MQTRTPPEPARPVRRGRAAIWVATTAAVYVLLLVYVDRERNLFSQLRQLAGPLLLCAALVLPGYLLRYQRWRLLLGGLETVHVSWWRGLWGYIAGFAFTASPGKAGELLRIRYFGWQGIAPRSTLTAFIFERAQDLLIITMLASGAATLIAAFGLLVGCVAMVVLGVAALALSPALGAFARRVVARLPGASVRRLGSFLVEGTCALAPLVGARLAVESALLGALAWLLTALAFWLLCDALGISLAMHLALGIYPLAMLIGALSFIPGGVGTTEAAIVLMLAATGVDTDRALTAAVGIRLASLWLAVLVGMLAVARLEVGRLWRVRS